MSDPDEARADTRTIREKLQHILDAITLPKSTTAETQDDESTRAEKRGTEAATSMKKSITDEANNELLQVKEEEIDSDESLPMEEESSTQEEEMSLGEVCSLDNSESISREQSEMVENFSTHFSSAETTSSWKRKYLEEYDDSESSTKCDTNDEGEYKNKDNDFDYNSCFLSDDKEEGIRVGEDYQATIPEGLCGEDGRPSSYGDGDEKGQLLWDPRQLPEEETERYLKTVFNVKCSANNTDSAEPGTSGRSDPTPDLVPSRIRDDEHALQSLLVSDFNLEKALLRRTEKPEKKKSTWSLRERVDFQRGILVFDKNFYQIHLHYVPTKSVSEMVEYFYAWKRTPEYDQFDKMRKRAQRRSDDDRNRYLNSTIRIESSESSEDD